MKRIKFTLGAILIALCSVNLPAQFLNNYCNAAFQYNFDTTTCTITASPIDFYPELTYTWTLAGQSVDGANLSFSYEYNTPEDYVYLSVSDGFGGCHALTSQTVEVTCAPYDCGGTAPFTTTIDTSNCTVTFTPVNPQPGLYYEWSFGDGSTILDTLGGVPVTHTYSYNGTYDAYVYAYLPSFICFDYSEQEVTIGCASPAIVTEIAIVDNPATCQTNFSVVNPNPNLNYSWIISGSDSYYYYGPSVNASFALSGTNNDVILYVQDATTLLYLDYVNEFFTPGCGTLFQCQVDAAFTHTFDSTTCTYTFAVANPSSSSSYQWNINNVYLSGPTVSYQPLYDVDSVTAILTAYQQIPNQHFFCTEHASITIGNSCSINGPCDLDGAYTVTLDSANCLYTFSITNPSSLPSVTYQWAIGQTYYYGPQIQVSFPYANQGAHMSLAIFTADHFCGLHQAISFTPTCGTLGSCTTDLLDFTATIDNASCEATVALDQALAPGTLYTWTIHTINFTAGGAYQNSTQTTFSFAAPYSGVYPIQFHAVTPAGCVLDTILYLNVNCGALPRACYTEPSMQADPYDAMAMWFYIPNMNWNNTYHWDFGDGTSETLDPTLHFYGNMMHQYNAPGIYQAVLTLTAPNCTSTFERTVNMGNVTGVENSPTASEPFSIYPNPTIDIVHVQLMSAESQAANIEIINAQGQLVHTAKINDVLTDLDVSFLPAGLYTLRLVDQNAQALGFKRLSLVK
jgi:hypothetical protein